MVNLARHEVARFQYSSTAGTVAEVLHTIGTTASDVYTRRAYITDLKVSCGGTARTFTIYANNYTGKRQAQALTFVLPANSTQSFQWELPYELIVLGSTGVNRSIVASASGAGVNYAVSGYVEK